MCLQNVLRHSAFFWEKNNPGDSGRFSTGIHIYSVLEKGIYLKSQYIP